MFDICYWENAKPTISSFSKLISLLVYIIITLFHLYRYIGPFLYWNVIIFCWVVSVITLVGNSHSVRLIDHYMTMNQKLHSHTWPTKILYSIGPQECLLGWVRKVYVILCMLVNIAYLLYLYTVHDALWHTFCITCSTVTWEISIRHKNIFHPFLFP